MRNFQTKQMQMKRGLIAICLIACLATLHGQSRYQKMDVPISLTQGKTRIETAIRPFFPELSSPETGLRLLHQRSSKTGEHYRLEQTWQGFPVQGAGLLAHVRNGRMVSCMNSLVQIKPQAMGEFELDVADLHSKLSGALNAYELRIAPVWYAEAQGMRPAYRVISFSHGDTASFELLIDARTGGGDAREVRDAYFARADTDTSGRARIFLPNPCTRADVAYGDLFTDNDDQHDPIFEFFIDTVVLRNITFQNDSFRLAGPYVKIEDIAPRTVAPAVSATGDFFFTRALSGFEDVMAYYHIDNFQRFVQSMGYYDLQNLPFRVDPHGHGNSDNSSFVPDGANSYIKFGEGGVDDAEDADVIVHEYGHALSEAASPDSRAGLERRGIDEGIGDYFATIYSRRILPFQWDKLFNWDGHNEFWTGRSASSSQQYPIVGTVSIYALGEVWNSTLMQIRAEIGDTIMDRLVFEEMFHNYPGMTLEDGARILLEIDSLLYGYAHREAIRFYFCKRGILSGELCLSVGVEAPEDRFRAVSVFPNPAAGEFTVRWGSRGASGQVSLALYDLLGREVYRQTVPAGQREARVSPSVSPGMYLLRVGDDKGQWAVEKIQIQ